MTDNIDAFAPGGPPWDDPEAGLASRDDLHYDPEAVIPSEIAPGCGCNNDMTTVQACLDDSFAAWEKADREDRVGDNPGSRLTEEEPDYLSLKMDCARARGARER